MSIAIVVVVLLALILGVLLAGYSCLGSALSVLLEEDAIVSMAVVVLVMHMYTNSMSQRRTFFRSYSCVGSGFDSRTISAP